MGGLPNFSPDLFYQNYYGLGSPIFGDAYSINFKLFSVALVYIDDIEDDNINYLEPKESLTKEQIRDFFQKELRSI